MKLYTNKLRYGGSVPVFGASTGTHYTKMYFDEDIVLGYEEQQPINYVTEIKMSNPRAVQTFNNYAKLNTGININQDLKWRAVFVNYKQDGGVVFGYDYTYYNYRAFTYDNQLFFDIGSSRIGTGWGIEGMPVVYDGTTEYDVTFQNFFYTNNKNGVVYNPNGHATSPANNYYFYVCLDPIGLRLLQIYDLTGTTLVFDGWPALDDNNVPCLYDKSSLSYKYFTVPSGSSSGNLTYK